MRDAVVVLGCVMIIAAFFCGCNERDGSQEGITPASPEDNKSSQPNEVGEVVEMRLTSTVYKEGDMIPRVYTCQGENINPPLRWDEAPSGTKSFALVFDDPDAPMATWYHWIVKDIPAEAREVRENSRPGSEVMNSWGNLRYGGPCPPSGIHRYIFHLYALSVPAIAAKNIQELQREVEKYKLGEATLMARYKKV